MVLNEAISTSGIFESNRNNSNSNNRYIDFSYAGNNNEFDVIVENAKDIHHTNNSIISNSISTNSKSSTNFPVRFHYMLSELEKDGHDDIISWQPHGRCFLVHKQKELVDKILPL